jgi:hypothetical protein
MSLLRAESTKYRSVRGWVLSSAAAALMILLFPVTGLSGGAPEETAPVPSGPEGEPVVASYYFVHRPLTGDGRLTVAVTALSSLRGSPWAKAGLIITAGPDPSARYAALMTTQEHGVRMQHDYLHDRPGPAEGARWLRLTRAGDTITGESSADGTTWSVVDTVQVPGLADTVEAGLFVACPPRVEGLGTAADVATATFTGFRPDGGWAPSRPGALGGDTTNPPTDDTTDPPTDGSPDPPTDDATGSPTDGSPDSSADGATGPGSSGTTDTAEVEEPILGSGDWTGDQVGADRPGFGGYPPGMSGGFAPSAAGITVTGTGDIGPAVRGEVPFGATIGELLAGTFPAMVVIVVAATLMVTTEYRYGLISTTLSTGNGRVQVLMAKAAVFGGVTFVTTLAATAAAIPLWSSLVRGMGIYLFPAEPAVLFRVAAGTAAVLTGVAVLALGAGVILRRSATAVTAVVAVTVLPYLLALVPFVPPPMAQWLARVTPAAALAVQQTLVRYPHVDSVYTPAYGYYPLPPWAGLAVLCGWIAVVLTVAAALLHRRDA